MADTHEELINNNIFFIEDEREGGKNVQKLLDNDADEVRKLNKCSALF